MYQHDVNGKTLRESLDQVIESCVNYVGVDLNTASAPLLSYVSGLNQLTARRIVEWRAQNGAFRRREQLRDVPGIGQATFTQAAGFLKIRAGDEPLDGTWIHPESYAIARQVTARLSAANGAAAEGPLVATGLREQLAAIDADQLAGELQIGPPTLRDIIDSLARPGRDPRADLAGPIFKKDILKMSDLQPGMELRGTVLNVVDFGAFVDVGLKESGLVHISRMSAQYIRSPHDKVSVGDVVTVWVLGVDAERKRVSLSLVPPGTPLAPRGRRSQEEKPPLTASSPPHETTAAAAPKATAPPAEQAKKTGRPKPAVPGKPHKKPAPKAPPLSAGAQSGEEPLRSFGQLKQLWNNKRSS
jgi:uncharacterized protein